MLLLVSHDGGAGFELYDLIVDPSETTNVAHLLPALVEMMRAELDRWQASCDESLVGADY